MKDYALGVYAVQPKMKCMYYFVDNGILRNAPIFLHSIDLHHQCIKDLNIVDKFKYLMSSDNVNTEVINKLAKLYLCV